jgi:hypothetical protein
MLFIEKSSHPVCFRTHEKKGEPPRMACIVAAADWPR